MVVWWRWIQELRNLCQVERVGARMREGKVVDVTAGGVVAGVAASTVR